MTLSLYSYSAFGLTIASELPLPDLPEGNGEADVRIGLGAIGESVQESSHWSVFAQPGEVHGWCPGAGAFQVRDGVSIVIEKSAAFDDRSARLAIVGPLLGVILMQRGRFVLHASTVAVGGEAVAFFGPSGRGKSTLVAAMVAAGHPLIADDMTVIDTASPLPTVQPGFPRVKLWPDSAAALAHDVEEMPLIHPDVTKRSLQTPDHFHAEALPLARCYELADGEAEAVSELPPLEATMSLIRSTYQAAWLHETGLSGPNLLHASALVRSGVVRRLERRRSFDVLGEVIEFIESDVRSRPARTAAPA